MAASGFRDGRDGTDEALGTLRGADRRRPRVRQAHAVGGAPRKKLRPVRRRELAAWFQAALHVNCVRACRLAGFSRAAWYRPSRAKDQSALRMRIREIAHARPRFGYLRICVLLRREGWVVNHKRVRRLYRLEGLLVRMRVRRRKHRALHRGPAPLAAGPVERWSMDFVHDALADGRPFRILTVVDRWSRRSPILEAGSSLTGRRVAEAIERVLTDGVMPRAITVDHGTEFQSRVTSIRRAVPSWRSSGRAAARSAGRGRAGRTT